MNEAEYDVLERCAVEAARRLIAKGVPKDRAIEIASEMAVEAAKRKYPDGMGQVEVGTQPLDTIAQESQAAANVPIIKSIREAVSPWLWVTSLIGFGMGLLNSKRIAKMYTDWKKKKGARR